MDIMDTQYYVYELVDPRNGEVFYVGKGNGDRMYRHRKQAFQPKASKLNPHRSARIRQIINEGCELKYNKIICRDEAAAFEEERKLIEKYGKRCDRTGILTNLTDGGEGYSGGHIPVCQYDLFGTFIKQFRSAKDAAAELGKKNGGSLITAVCRGGRRGEVSAYGYLWSYVGEAPRTRTKIIPVYMWTISGQLKRKFPSAAAAADYVGCDPSNIPRAIRSGWVSSNCLWSYAPVFPGPPQNKKVRKVEHINTGKVYMTVSEAAKDTAHTVQSICAVCSGKKQKVGNDYFRYCVSDQC